MISLSFHGAAGVVTGSKYLVTVGKHRVMVDCGMFQGPRELRQRNWEPLPFDASSVNAVVITHAHIDHVGYLPRLVREGFRGPVFASAPTVDITRLNLADAAHLQMEDAEYRNRKNLTRHKKALPLFDTTDITRLEKLYLTAPIGEWMSVLDGVDFRLHYAGHILGATSVEMRLNDGEREVSILFSGDIGRYGNPLTRNPGKAPSCDYLVSESTYGGRLHPPADHYTEFLELVKGCCERKGVLLVPAFAIGRTQQIVYLLDHLADKGEIPRLDVYIDSPMAIKATEIYRRYPDLHAVDIEKFESLHGPRVHLVRTRDESKKLNKLDGPAVIVSASGMLTAGRILHHLKQRLPDPRNTLALVGYMAEGTLGRKILEGEKKVYIHKHPVDVRARVEVMNGFSGHADYNELLHWAESITKDPRRVFITHGEPSQAQAMAGHYQHERGWQCHLPEHGETVEL